GHLRRLFVVGFSRGLRRHGGYISSLFYFRGGQRFADSAPAPVSRGRGFPGRDQRRVVGSHRRGGLAFGAGFARGFSDGDPGPGGLLTAPSVTSELRLAGPRRRFLGDAGGFHALNRFGERRFF